MRYQHKKNQRGNALIEFGLVAVVSIPLMFGTLSLGLSLGNSIQSIQISRDVAHMYAKGVDFSVMQNQSIAANLASGYDLSSGGNSVLILSQIVKVYQADCDAAGYTVGSGLCSNLDQNVFVNRIVMGNSSLKASDFGTPNSGYMNAQGNIAASNYLRQTDARATGFAALLAQNQGEVAYVAELWIPVPNFNFSGSTSTPGVFARAIF